MHRKPTDAAPGRAAPKGTAAKGSAAKGGAAKGGAAKGGKTAGSPGARDKAAEEESVRKASEAAAALEAAKAAREAEQARKDAFIKAKEEKRAQLANSHTAALLRRRAEELEIQAQRNQLRAEENARKREAREHAEKGAAWPFKMPLHAAALTGDKKVAEVFLREDEEGSFNIARIDPNSKWREDGQSPIFLATVKGQLEMIERLLQAKADVNITNNDGRAPLALGAEFGQISAMKILLDAGADINARDIRGRTALHVAVSFNRVNTVQQLMAWKADPNLQTKTQFATPLHMAAAHPRQNMLMIFLLLAGPDLPLLELAKTMGGSEEAPQQVDACQREDGGVQRREEGEAVESREQESHDVAEDWRSDSDTGGEEDETADTDEGIPRLRPGVAWERFATSNCAETTLQGLARVRLKGSYPEEWMYSDEDDLLELVMARCPGLPLPPYWSSVAVVDAQDETPMDAAPRGSAIHRALEAACLLDNERNERLTEDEEKASGILRPSLTGEKQMARRRTRKLALVIGNGKGPGGIDTPVCRADAQSVAMHLKDVGFNLTLVIDASLEQMLDAIAAFARLIVDSDVVVFYFSGHVRSACGFNYLVPSGGPTDNLDSAEKFATRAVSLRTDVIRAMQVAAGTLTFIILDCFRASQAIPAPAGCGLWRQGKGDWHTRLPSVFLPHIRPPGLASSNMVYPPHPDPKQDEDQSFARAGSDIGRTPSGRVSDVFDRSLSFDRSFSAESMDSRPEEAGQGEAPKAYMEGNIDGVPKNMWSVLAGDSPLHESDIEELLAEDASMCLVYSSSPGGELFANNPMLKSPFTEQFTTHVYNPGGGANHAGGNYPMMFADIGSSVMKMTQGRQMPWVSIVPDDADKAFCFVPENIQGKGGACVPQL